MTYRDVEHRCVGCGATLAPGYAAGVACERCRRCDGSPRRACPHCGEPMDLVWIDFLQLDQCVEHGVWLDAGELDKALTSAQSNPELKDLVERLQKRAHPDR